MGHPVRAGIRETLAPIFSTRRNFLALRRDARFHSRQMALLYRAVDKHGMTVDFLLRRDRGIAAAQAFFSKALATITIDGRAR